ncbi:unnamed protein product [Prunus armeniaca]
MECPTWVLIASVIAEKDFHPSSEVLFSLICSNCWKGAYVSGIGGTSFSHVLQRSIFCPEGNLLVMLIDPQDKNFIKSISQRAEDTLPSPPLGTPDTATGTSSQLPAALPPTSPFLGTPDTAAGTSSQLPAVLPRGEIIDNSHKNSDVLTSIGHLSEGNMSW